MVISICIFFIEFDRSLKWTDCFVYFVDSDVSQAEVVMDQRMIGSFLQNRLVRFDCKLIPKLSTRGHALSPSYKYERALYAARWTIFKYKKGNRPHLVLHVNRRVLRYSLSTIPGSSSEQGIFTNDTYGWRGNCVKSFHQESRPNFQ